VTTLSASRLTMAMTEVSLCLPGIANISRQTRRAGDRAEWAVEQYQAMDSGRWLGSSRGGSSRTTVSGRMRGGGLLSLATWLTWKGRCPRYPVRSCGLD
jgi:hypothetical protein